MDKILNEKIAKLNYKKLFHKNNFINQKNNEILWITVINRGYIGYTLNFLESMRRSDCNFKLTIYYIGVEGIESFEGQDNCICINTEGILPNSNFATELHTHGTLDFRRICFAKLDLIKYTFSTNQTKYVGYIDTDIVLFSDPTKHILEAFNQNSELQIVFQCDECGYSCSNKNKCQMRCCGLMVYKKSSTVLKLMKYKEEDIYKYGNADQEYLNNLINERDISTKTIARKIFINGAYPHIFTGIIPKGACLIHFNYLIGNEKQRKMREMGLWYEDRNKYIMPLYKWQQTIKNNDDLIVQASSIAPIIDEWQPFPIGMCFQYVWNYRKTEQIQLGSHENTALLAVCLTSDIVRRPNGINRRSIVATLKSNGFENKVLEHKEYFESLPSYKFVISPEGNGLDCHRHYESLLAGCIPIMEKNPLIEEKYKGCPVLFTVDYSEITEDYLNTQYPIILNKTYDFSRLFLSSYSKFVRENIQKCGNYWTQFHTGKKFYKSNLIYMCVFHNVDYINLLELLIISMVEKSASIIETSDILILTSELFKTLIEERLAPFNISFKYYIISVYSLFESSAARLHIFNYEFIDNYKKILYLDTDILINNDLNMLFNLEISNDKLYALEEGYIGEEYWGSQFFDFNEIDRNTTAFTAGLLYFKNTDENKCLFEDIKSHINSFLSDKNNTLLICMEQTFIVYQAVSKNKYNNQIMKQYMENNPVEVNKAYVIYHFPGDPGDYSSKHEKMSRFWKLMR
jgi:lipopolysaccharide biosynthesis glycosyltransferase